MTEAFSILSSILASSAGHGTSGSAADVEWPLLFLIPFFPFVGFLVTYLLTSRNRALHSLSGWIASGAAAASFVVVVMAYTALSADGVLALHHTAWRWMTVGTLDVELAFRFDHLSAVMCLVVTGIGTLIHVYAIGYMAEDESRPRFFCYLNLFLFSMLLLVLGKNLLVMFVGWEGVGLCSYLLIGFWSREMANTVAGQKAFVVNRIGDAGFLLGMFLIFQQTGTLDFLGIQAHMGDFYSSTLIDAAALLLFVGAVGKSAQIPLFVWLPDAMAGPTPVSALIHAATMVTAGVYMIARNHFLFEASPLALSVILVIGTATAFLAATIALVQNDIKKVLAYSTVSQLGYMFMAMGAGAFSFGIYHVVTHAFFKACLFMGAGSVIMGCHHEQDMRQFGGLRKSMPITFLTYAAAVYAICGLWPGSGYYSKDAILWSVYSSPIDLGIIAGFPVTKLLWGAGLATAFLTAFYMTRSLMLTFFGEYRGHAHPHESPKVVWIPLVLLAIPSILFAVIFGSQFLHYLHTWTPERLMHENLSEAAQHLEHQLALISLAVAAAGVGLAVCIYQLRPMLAKQIADKMPALYRFLLDKWRIDELYNAIIVRPLLLTASLLFRGIDRILVDGTVNGAAVFVEANGDVVRRVHTGKIGQYALWMFLGNVAIILFWFLLS